MNYLTRQTDSIWTSPKGKVFNLKTDGNSGYSRKHIGEVKTNPVDSKKGQNKTKKITDCTDTFTDSGISGKDVTLKCLFIGENHDIDSEKFSNALCETGKSRLKLPYGEEFSVNVIEFSCSYSTVENINSTVVSVNFHQTSKTTYPKSSSSNAKQIENSADKTNKALAQNLTDAVSSASTPAMVESLNKNFSNILNTVSKNLDTINNISLNSIMSDIAGQNLASNTFTMVTQLQIVMQKAAVASSRVKNLTQIANSSSFGSLCRTWKNLINELYSSNYTKAERLNREQILNFTMSDTIVQSSIAGIAQAGVQAEYETRKEAINAAASLIELDETRTEFVTEQIEKIENLQDTFVCDTGISELVNAAANAIIEKSFALKVERTINLAEDEAVINLAYKYYRDSFELNPEKTIEYLISTNGFSDAEYFILSKGMDLKIYV